MSEQPQSEAPQDKNVPTPTEVDAALQQAAHRAAAMRAVATTEDQVFDSANEVGMGQQDADDFRDGHDTEGAFGEEDVPPDRLPLGR